MASSLRLAWMQLIHARLRSLVAIAGVTFAVVLMLMQMGFRTALYTSAVRLHAHFDGDIFLVSPQSAYLANMKSFSRRGLYQALGEPEVASVGAVCMTLVLWKNPDTGRTRNILVVGYDPQQPVLDLPDVKRYAQSLDLPDSVLFDSAGRPEFGPVAERVKRGQAVTTEVANRRVTVVGLFELGTSFGIDGSIVTSDLNFQRIHPRDGGLIELGVIKLKPGADAELVRQRLAARLPDDADVLTKRQYMDREINYWAKVTPIGFIFAFGAVMGFVVGTMIVYQILFADVADHMPEYATLKAIGYRNRFVFGVVLCQAVILSVFGFVPGVVISSRLYHAAEESTHLPMQLTPALALVMLGLTVAMCCLSGAVAVRKVRSADPAEIF